jgi:crotonobetainyl-CoA:carnitine CoA-transferase CaiB-like acyl-CoA transferase
VRAASPTGGALAGVRVVDLSRVLAGPLCTQMLADHGASVIKVEPPTGDETRRLGPPFDDDGDAAYFNALNRGKRAISLDLSSPAAREVLDRLLEDADVLVENFVPGTMERWGIGYEAVLAARFPRLVYCSISGFGTDGPLGGLPGYDAVVQAMCGLMSVNGSAQSGPLRVGVPVVDMFTGYSAMNGILLALQARHRTQRGQRVETTLFDTALGILFPQAANWLCSGRAPVLLGSAHPNIAPYDKFNTGDGELFIGILNENQFRRFCAQIGRADLLEDDRFRSNADRLTHRDALKREIERTLASESAESLSHALMENNVPAGRVNSIPEIFRHEHVVHREMLVDRGDYREVGIPVKLSDTPGQPGARAPKFGEHGVEILRDAGFDAEAIRILTETGAVVGRSRTG